MLRHDQRVDDRLARSQPKCLVLRRRTARGARSSLRARSAASPVSNDARWRSRSGYSASSPAADLRQPRVACDERRRARCCGLGGDDSERLGEDRRHDGRVSERQQMNQVTVLQRAGEERARRRCCLEHRAVGAEADDDEARIDSLHRLEQHLHALLLDQLAEVDDQRPGPSRETERAGRRCRRRAGARRRRSADPRAPPPAGSRVLRPGPAA